MDLDKLRKSVSLNLRCVAQSCKDGVPLSSLQGDYKALIGTAIPFIELGYNTLESFLQSIPDVVCLKKNKSGQCFVEGVADASTAHIAKLISRQKTTAKGTKKNNFKKPSRPIRKYPCHESWKSTPTSSGGMCKQVSKTSTTNPANPKVPVPKPAKSTAISSTPRKTIPANQNNVINSQSNTNANPFGEGPSNARKSFSSLFTSTEPLIRPPVPAGNLAKLSEIQEKGTCNRPKILNVLKEVVPLSYIVEESSLSKRQIKRRRKKAAKEISSNLFESPLTKNQRKKLRKKIKKAEKIHEPTQLFLEMLKENRIPLIFRSENQSPQSYDIVDLPSVQYPLETIPPPVGPTPIAISESSLPSFHQGKSSGFVIQKETASNYVYKSSLNCFPKIRHNVKSAKFNSLLMMNFLLFGNDSYMETLKRGILAFDGFSFYEGSEQWKQKEILLSMLPEDTLRESLKLLCIECISDNKKELVLKLLQFLASPGDTLSNGGKKEAPEKIFKKEEVDNTGVAFGSFDINVLDNLKQLQEYVHNQEFKTLSKVNVNLASTSKSSNNIESAHVPQPKKLNAKPSTVKVVQKKKSNKSAKISSNKSSSVKTEQFQKLQSMLNLNPTSGVLEKSAKKSQGAVSTGKSKSKSCQCQAFYSQGIQCTCPKNK